MQDAKLQTDAKQVERDAKTTRKGLKIITKRNAK